MQILLTLDDSWSKQEAEGAADFLAGNYPGVASAKAVDGHCGACESKCGEQGQ